MVAIPNRRRSTQLNVRVTPEERWVIRAAANHAGLTVAEFLRRLLLDEGFRRRCSAYVGPLTRRLAASGLVESCYETEGE